MKAVVQGGAVCPLRTRHISLVLKFFLHFSQTGNRLSGNLTFKDCLNPGGVKVRTFWGGRTVSQLHDQCWILIPMNLPHAIVPVETSFADAS